MAATGATAAPAVAADPAPAVAKPAAAAPDAAWVIQPQCTLDIESLEWDVDASRGQVRAMEEAHLRDVLDSFRASPPQQGIQVVCVATDHTGV